MPAPHDDDELLAQWAQDVTGALGQSGLAVDVQTVLGLAGRAAHAVARPAAPLTTFIVGYAAGAAAARGAEPATAVREAVDAALALCRARAAHTAS